MEASIIFPLVIITILVSLYIAFYIHDKVILSQLAYDSALKASERYIDDDAQLTHVIYEYGAKTVQNRLLVAKDIIMSTNLSGSEITVTYIGKVYIPFSTFVQNLYHKTDLTLRVSKEVKKTEPVKFVRKIKRTKEFFE